MEVEDTHIKKKRLKGLDVNWIVYMDSEFIQNGG